MPLNQVTLENQSFVPSKILCVGRNYVAHIEELGNEVPQDMVVFMKPNASLSQQLNSFHDEPLHYEAELCFLVKDGEFSGVAIGLDLTKRDTQSALKAKGLPWERAKAFDGSAVISEFVPFTGDFKDLSLELWINDQLIQQGGVELMLYPPQVIKQELSKFTSLEDGDIVMTGTPKGVGVVHKGARFVGKVFQGGQCLVESCWIAS